MSAEQHIAQHREDARMLASMDEALAGHHGIARAAPVPLGQIGFR